LRGVEYYKNIFDLKKLKKKKNYKGIEKTSHIYPKFSNIIQVGQEQFDPVLAGVETTQAVHVT
jgi:hypothetical protein